MIKYCDAPYYYDSMEFPHHVRYGLVRFYRIDLLIRDRATGACISHHFYCSCCKSKAWMEHSFCERPPETLELVFEVTELNRQVRNCPHITTHLAYRGIYTAQFVEAMLKLNFRLHPVPFIKLLRDRFLKKQNN